MKENEITTIYSDGIGKIHFFGNMIRLDFMDFVPSENDDSNAKPEPKVTTRIVMNPNAFLASYESFMNMIEKLSKAGVLTAVDNEKAEGSNEAAATVEEVKAEEATEAPAKN